MSTRERVGWAVVVGVAVGMAAWNASLWGDDLYLLEAFQIWRRTHGLGRALEITFLNLDLGSREYRLYGFSRLLHFGLGAVFGTAAWGYAIFMAAAQAATALVIRRLVLALDGDRVLANALGVVWLLSPFATTTCFHHYSYAILPYELTAGCALVVLLRGPLWASAVLGLLVALTGESHLPFAGVAIVFAAVARRGDGYRWRLAGAAVPLLTIGVAVVVHRLLWQSFVVVTDQQRYTLRMPEPARALEITQIFAVSLWRGLVAQVQPIVSYSRASFLLLAPVLVVLFVLFAYYADRRDSGHGALPRAAAAALLLVSSLVVLLALAVLSGQVHGSLPRRYGFVPYTLLAMFLIAALWWTRRYLTSWPAAVACACPVWLWCCLELLLWPSIRVEDGRVWAGVRSAAAGRSIVFSAAWDRDATRYDYPQSHAIFSFRGPDAPDVIESTLSGYLWEAQYAFLFAGAPFAAFKAVDVGNGNVKLFGNDLNGRPPRVIRISDVVLVSDDRPTPPRWWEAPRVSVAPLSQTGAMLTR